MGNYGSSYAAARCEHPVDAVLRTLDCIVREDLPCALAGYAPDFKKLHNGVDTNTVIDEEFWKGAFQLVDISLSYNHMAEVGRNFVSLRYIEEVTTADVSSFGNPDGPEAPPVETIIQHEHALITVDDDCRMVTHDQYGDNAEQVAVDDALNKILEYLFPPETETPCANKKVDIKDVDLNEFFRASWYAQFQKESIFEKQEDFQCRTATYDFNPAGIEGVPEDVVTAYANNRFGNPDRDIELTLAVDGPGKLKVAPCDVFDLETAGNFWVLDYGVDETTGEYEWGVIISGNPTVTEPDGKCSVPFGNGGIWLYTREKVASKETIAKMFEALEKQGVSPFGLLPVEQGEDVCGDIYANLRLKPDTNKVLEARRCVPQPVEGLPPCFLQLGGACDPTIPAPAGFGGDEALPPCIDGLEGPCDPSLPVPPAGPPSDNGGATGLPPCFLNFPGPCDPTISAPDADSDAPPASGFDSIGRPCGTPFAQC